MVPLLSAALPFARFAYADYVESYQTWSATSGDNWQVQDLSGAPYSVPANAVVEVAVRNSRTVAEYWGGVRAVGSSLDRRFQLHEAEGGGDDLATMFVEADGTANATIEVYADVDAGVDFVLVGYWSTPPGT